MHSGGVGVSWTDVLALKRCVAGRLVLALDTVGVGERIGGRFANHRSDVAANKGWKANMAGYVLITHPHAVCGRKL